jgi:hypothetical protein
LPFVLFKKKVKFGLIEEKTPPRVNGGDGGGK